ncbi:hypothetical protein PGT21_023615 [Puccinia graminis f. sp. tritici]|uniref:Uncharacterized protein n=1 Tax=Puccinia graminis f. sp. tritici TaxID=56615 RepID=A0A5B0R234_PUCGR|nr:hypothetical protein PGT21_023615 [Puccinia graminis f. sp. tritici]
MYSKKALGDATNWDSGRAVTQPIINQYGPTSQRPRELDLFSSSAAHPVGSIRFRTW